MLDQKHQEGRNRRTRLSRYLGILLAFLALLSAGLLSRMSVDLTQGIPILKRNIEERINGTVDMKGIRLRLLPYPRIRGAVSSRWARATCPGSFPPRHR